VLSMYPSAVVVSPCNLHSRLDAKNRNSIGDSDDPWGIPLSVWMSSLVYPVKARRVTLSLRNDLVNLCTYSGRRAIFRLCKSLSWETWS
jgi:hypothetical protein